MKRIVGSHTRSTREREDPQKTLKKLKSIFSTQKVISLLFLLLNFQLSSSGGMWVHALLQSKPKRLVDLGCFLLIFLSVSVVATIVNYKIATSSLF